MAVQDIVRPDRGTARKHHAKTAALSGASGGLTESERQDSEGNEPVAMLLSADTDEVTFRMDGGTPADGDGHQIAVSDPPKYHAGIGNIKQLDWIGSGGADGTIQITLLY